MMVQNHFTGMNHSLTEIAQLMKKYPIFITNTEQDDPFLKAFSLVPETERSSVKGAISVSRLDHCQQDITNVRTIGADMWDAHHKGADAVTELALSLAEAAESSCKSGQF